MRGSDMLVPYYRDLGLVLGVGVTPLDLLTNMFAREADLSGGRQFPNHYTARERGVLSISSIIAAHCTHAAGVAYALTYNGESGRAVLCSTGEGATSQGEWHEARQLLRDPQAADRVSRPEQRLGDLDAAVAADGDRRRRR